MNVIRMITSIWELYSPQMCDHIPPLLRQGWCNKGRGYRKLPEERQDIDKTYLWKQHLFLGGEDDGVGVIYLLCWKVYLERSYTHSHSAPQSEQKERVNSILTIQSFQIVRSSFLFLLPSIKGAVVPFHSCSSHSQGIRTAFRPCLRCTRFQVQAEEKSLMLRCWHHQQYCQ